MRNKILYLVIGICCIGLTACTHDSDEPTSVIKNEISRSTITVERTVTLTTPGTLQEELEKVIDDVSTLQKLTIEGPYNGIDVEYWKNSLNQTDLLNFESNFIENKYKEFKDLQDYVVFIAMCIKYFYYSTGTVNFEADDNDQYEEYSTTGSASDEELVDTYIASLEAATPEELAAIKTM